ncbi:hypothetical protein [Oceanobacillus jeddahense]|uniref:hypothetical protein n=1 Tax=Oceanobacillus jeddahense TaxID=1462527 RepID=UPI0005963572|nr:hypothetical protein [Oceanobacillus jeddahense]
MTEKYKLFLDKIKVHENLLKKEVELAKEFESDAPYVDDFQKKKIVERDEESIIFISKKEINEFKYNKDCDEIYHNRITGQALNYWLDFVVDKVKV